MTIAYIVLAHRDGEQLARLVRRLSSPGALCFVHVDRRAADSVVETARAGTASLPDVEWIERRRCYWGGFGIIQATLDAIGRVLEAPRQPDYAILLSGQDYPLRSVAAIDQFFAGAGGRSFIDCRPATGRFRERIEGVHWHGEIRGRRVRVPNRFVPLTYRRRLPAGLTPFWGSAFWALSRPALAYVHEFAANNPDVVRFFRRSSVVDEAFFQTVLGNSPLAGTIENRNLHHIDWRDERPSPRVLTSEDLPTLGASDALFARKFDRAVDERVLDALDARAAGAAAPGATAPETLAGTAGRSVAS